MKKISSQDNPIYISESFISSIHALESGQGLLCTVMAFNETVPMVLSRLTQEDINYFGVGPRNFPCNRNLRYLDYQDDEMIEFVFRLKRRRLLHVDMDPSATDCREFLALCLDTEKMAAGFYCPEMPLLAATCWQWGDDEIDWLSRNQSRAERLKANDFTNVVKICHGTNNKDRVCLIQSQNRLLPTKAINMVPFMDIVNTQKEKM